MNENIQKTCDLIIENRDAIIKKMFWELDANTYAVMAGLLTTASGVKADADRYQICKDILKKNAGIFSELRGLAGAMVATKMMLQEDPEAYIKGVTEVYHKLRDIHKLTASPYMVMAAINIYDNQGSGLTDAEIEKFERIYNELKKQHPMIVGDSARGYLSMVTTSGVDLEKIPEMVEAAYKVCEKLSLDKPAVHSMAQILALSDKSPEEKFEFVDTMLKGLDKNKTPIGKDQGLAVLGALALLDIPAEQLINDISDASNYLKGKSGFRWYEEGTRMRTIFAAIAVFLTYAKEKAALGKVISSNIAMSIAEEILLVIVVIVMITSISVSANASH